MNPNSPALVNGHSAQQSPLVPNPNDERPLPPFDSGHGYSNEPEDDAFDWQRFYAILRRRRKIVAATVATIFALAVVYVVLAPRIYRTTAGLLINSNKTAGGELSDSPFLQTLVGATQTRSQDTEVEILKSAAVKRAAIKLMPATQRPRLGKDYVVEIEPKRSTDIINISVSGRNPSAIIALSNAICEAYKNQNQRISTESYSKTAVFVGKQLEGVGKKLDQKRAELQDFKERQGIVDFTAQSQALVSQLLDMENSLRQTQADGSANQAQLQDLRAQARQIAPSAIIPDTIVTSPVVSQIQTDLTALESQRLTAIQEFTPQSPEVSELNQRIKALRARLNTQAKTVVGTSKNTVNPVRQGIDTKVSQVRADIWAGQARARALQSNIALARKNVSTLPASERKLSQIQSELASYEATFLSLNDKYQTLKITESTPVANARVVNAAEGASLVSPRVGSTLMMSLFGGLLLAIALALIVDSLDNRIYTEDDATRASGLPVLTHVPVWESADKKRLLISNADSSVLLESFRMLRTQLNFISSYGGMKSIVVTSSQPGEGKSTVSTNLAIALALNGKSVILIDADLRRPQVHTFFEQKNINGFTDIIAGECSVEEALRETGIENLRFLPAGPMPPNPPELLDSPKARALVADLKTRADYVIIDAPPALVMADAQIAATMADGVLLVVSCQDAGRHAVTRTTELMAQTGVKIVGMVLNKFSVQENGYYGYYGYAYSYSKYGLDTSANGKNSKNGKKSEKTAKSLSQKN